MKQHKNTGFSLIELLCAMSIGLLIIAILSTVFLFCKRIHEMTKTQVMVNDNLRYAGFYLKASISNAGFIGCHRLTTDFPVINNGVLKEDQLFFDHVLKVYAGDQNPWGLSTPYDVIEVHAMSSLTAHLLQHVEHTKQLTVSFDMSFNVGDDILIADCHHAESLQVQSIKIIPGVGQVLTLTQSLQSVFDENAVVGLLVTKIFFIRNTARKDITGAFIPALYEMGVTGEKTEIVAGIESWKITAYLKHFLIMPADQIEEAASMPIVRIDLTEALHSEHLVNLPSIEKSLSIFITLGDGHVIS